MNIEYKMLHGVPMVPLLDPATDGSAGMDIRIDNPGLLFIQAGETIKIGTGLAVWIKDKNYVGIVVARSSTANNGLMLTNAVGVIDSDYQGEIFLNIHNYTDHKVRLLSYQRVAQLLIVPVIRPNMQLVQDFSSRTERAAQGFGSTGSV